MREVNVKRMRTQGNQSFWNIQRRLVVIEICFVAYFASSGIAAASPTGTLGIGSAGTISATLTSLLWNHDPSSTPAGPPWNGEVNTGTNLVFAGCPSGVINTPGCLSATEAILINNGVAFTSNAILPINNWYQFAAPAHANLIYSLTQVGAGSANTNCAALVNPGDSCSVFAGSPIVLTLGSFNTTTASVAFAGKASDTGVGGLATGSNWQGKFSADIPNMTPKDIQLFFCPSGTCTPADFASGTTLTQPNVSGSFFATTIPTLTGCTLTQGGYKNHFNSLLLNFPGVPPGSHGLTIGTVFYTDAQLNLIMQNNAIKGNGLLSLAHQLITAELNLAYGGVPSNPAQAATLIVAISAANSLIGGLVIPPIGNGSLSPAVTSTLEGFFDSYNNGKFGIPHCND